MKMHRLHTISRADAEVVIARSTAKQLNGRHDLRNHSSAHVRRQYENKLLLTAWRRLHPTADTVRGVVAAMRNLATMP
jgi:hypothetical protein